MGERVRREGQGARGCIPLPKTTALVRGPLLQLSAFPSGLAWEWPHLFLQITQGVLHHPSVLYPDLFNSPRNSSLAP